MGHYYFLIYYFLNCVNVSFAIFKAVLPLYFVRSIHRGAVLTLIFRTLYSWNVHTLCPWLYEVLASISAHYTVDGRHIKFLCMFELECIYSG